MIVNTCVCGKNKVKWVHLAKKDSLRLLLYMEPIDFLSIFVLCKRSIFNCTTVERIYSSYHHAWQQLSAAPPHLCNSKLTHMHTSTFTCTYRYTVALKPHSPAKHTICMWAGSFISFSFRCFSDCYIHILHSLQYISDWYYLTIKPWHTCRGASVWPSGTHPRTSHVHMLILLHWKSQDTAKWQCLQPGDNSIYQPGIVTHTHTHT